MSVEEEEEEEDDGVGVNLIPSLDNIFENVFLSNILKSKIYIASKYDFLRFICQREGIKRVVKCKPMYPEWILLDHYVRKGQIMNSTLKVGF